VKQIAPIPIKHWQQCIVSSFIPYLWSSKR